MTAIDLTTVFNSVELDKAALKLYNECFARGLKDNSPTQISVTYCNQSKLFTVQETLRNGIHLKVKDLLSLTENIKDEQILFHFRDENGRHEYKWTELPAIIL